MSRTGPIERALDDLIARHDGRAAGLWRREGGALRLACFRPAPGLPDAVRDGFAAATKTVPLSASELSIVQACAGGRAVLAITETLPPDAGSGRWLRAFGAACSLAVPIVHADGAAGGVLSVAMARVPEAPEALAAEFGAVGAGLLGAAGGGVEPAPSA